jgi:hypothetical protein
MVKIAYPGSNDLQPFQNLNINKLGLLQAALDHRKTVSGRDSEEAGISIAKRLTLGYTRVQGPNSPRSEYYNGYAKPFLSIDKLGYIPPETRRDLSLLLTRGQVFLDKVYSQPFQDSTRTLLFGYQMASQFSLLCLSSFEFVGVFVESNATLQRHMDYQNDDTKGYNYGVSYSYVVHHLSSFYRVNVIMTSRVYCGYFMSKLAQP